MLSQKAQAQKYVVWKAADPEPRWYIRNQTAPMCPRLSLATGTGPSACPPGSQPEAPAAPGLRAAVGYQLQLDLSVAARNAIFFISIYKLPGILSTTLTMITLRAGGSFCPDKHFTGC